MPAITCIGDLSSGHDMCSPVPAISGANSVTVNGRPVVCVGDTYAVHSCDDHAPHQGFLSSGAPFVTINGKAVGRVGDKISCGGTVAEGYKSVSIGNGGGNSLF